MMTVVVKNGSIYLSAETAARFFPAATSVAILRRDGDLIITPITPGSGGGLALKTRNAEGDKVAHCPDTLHRFGLDPDANALTLPARWDAAIAGLRLGRPGAR